MDDARMANNGGPWIKCAHCDNWFCMIHEQHAHECECPSVDEWTADPYNVDDGGRLFLELYG